MSRTPSGGEPLRHQQRAQQDGVGQRFRHRLEPMPVPVERRGVRPQRLAAVAQQFRRQMFQQAHFGQLVKRALRGARSEDLVELFEESRRRGLRDQAGVPPNRVDHRRIDDEVEARGQHDRAQHANRILREPDIRIADAADHPRLDVVEAAGVVDDRERRDVVEDRVDREVAPEGVLLRRAKRVVAEVQVRLVAVAAARLLCLGDLGLLRRLGCRGRLLLHLGLAQLPAERRDLDGLGAELHMSQTKPPADDPAVAEQLLHLVRVGRGADVEVFRTPTKEQVAHAAAHQVRHVVVVPQPLKHLQRIRVDERSRDRMVFSGNDRRRDHWASAAHSIKCGRFAAASAFVSMAYTPHLTL